MCLTQPQKLCACVCVAIKHGLPDITDPAVICAQSLHG